MYRQIAIAGVKPRRLAKLPHGLQAEKSIAFDAPAALAAEQAGKNVSDGVDVRGHVESPPQQVVASVDDESDFFRWDHLPQTIDELGAARAAGEYTNHAALFSLARPSPSRAASSFSESNPDLDMSAGKNSG